MIVSESQVGSSNPHERFIAMLSCAALPVMPVRFPVGYFGAAYTIFPVPGDGYARCDDPQAIYRRRVDVCEVERVANGVWWDVKFCLDSHGNH